MQHLRAVGSQVAGRKCLRNEDSAMYAVIRTGGKQYLVSPGEKLRIERTGHTEGDIEFLDVLAVSHEEGKFASELAGAKVTGTVLGLGRGDKILVFKMKRKKQYKKMQGHRQNFVEVRINEILINGKSYKAEGEETAAPKAEKKPAAKHAKKTEAAAE
jgi:large subunit ribosomal protein L21